MFLALHFPTNEVSATKGDKKLNIKSEKIKY